MPSKLFSFELHLICKSNISMGEVEVFIDTNNKSWIRIPTYLFSKIVPKEKKREITKLEVSDDLIEGKYKNGRVIKEPFSINRKTGSISVRGFESDYNGECIKFVKTENKF